MALSDPFAVYNAASNLEAQLVCGFLIDAGIEAKVIEDANQAAAWLGLGGTVSELQKSQVWIERADTDRAKPVLAEYEQHAAERLKGRGAGGPIEVVCEECGKSSTFPAAERGAVENCPHCGAYVDVGSEDEIEGWDETPGEEEQEAE